MNPWTRRVVGGMLLAGGAAALAWLSEIPYAASRPGAALIRLSWRAFSEQVRACRRLTPDELARRPVHMRQDEICERTILPYRLHVSLDGVSVVNRLVRSGGAREDRPLYVLHDLPVAPGSHRLVIAFEREGAGDAHDEQEPMPEHEARETPPILRLDETIEIPERRVMLVTYDETTRRLRLLAGAQPGS